MQRHHPTIRKLQNCRRYDGIDGGDLVVGVDGTDGGNFVVGFDGMDGGDLVVPFFEYLPELSPDITLLGLLGEK